MEIEDGERLHTWLGCFFFLHIGRYGRTGLVEMEICRGYKIDNVERVIGLYADEGTLEAGKLASYLGTIATQLAGRHTDLKDG
jgi:hypothetical protein